MKRELRAEPRAGGGEFRASLPVALTVQELRRENARMVTLFLPLPEPGCAAPQGLDMAAFRPGRFFMLWLPRLDEKPYAVSYLDGERLGITVLERGPFSRRLCDLEPGATLGLRGPFGRAFWDYERHADSERAALVGGGCGMAVLAPLADRLPRASVVQGARSADGLLYEERARR
ncbi:MAG: ferredoxin reductase domain-containing protein [Planctomycetota bacterium]|jgi:NAD(P)H-flavin reductase